jgi:hypothetical protein
VDKDYENFVARMGSFNMDFNNSETEDQPMTDKELKHFGVIGMHWGQRRRAKMEAKAEKILGRKIKPSDGWGKNDRITNKEIKMVKEYDEMDARYKKVKKKGDLALDYMLGYDPLLGVAVSRKGVDRIIKKLEKDPSASVKDLYQKEKKRALRTNTVVRSAGTLTVLAATTAYLNNQQAVDSFVLKQAGKVTSKL